MMIAASCQMLSPISYQTNLMARQLKNGVNTNCRRIFKFVKFIRTRYSRNISLRSPYGHFGEETLVDVLMFRSACAYGGVYCGGLRIRRLSQGTRRSFRTETSSVELCRISSCLRAFPFLDHDMKVGGGLVLLIMLVAIPMSRFEAYRSFYAVVLCCS